MFPLGEALDETLGSAAGLPIIERLDGFLQTVTSNFRTVREIAAEDAPFSMYLIGGKEQAAGGNAYD